MPSCTGVRNNGTIKKRQTSGMHPFRVYSILTPLSLHTAPTARFVQQLFAPAGPAHASHRRLAASPTNCALRQSFPGIVYTGQRLVAPRETPLERPSSLPSSSATTIPTLELTATIQTIKFLCRSPTPHPIRRAGRHHQGPKRAASDDLPPEFVPPLAPAALGLELMPHGVHIPLVLLLRGLPPRCRLPTRRRIQCRCKAPWTPRAAALAARPAQA
jgi:hypothetical protein